MASAAYNEWVQPFWVLLERDPSLSSSHRHLNYSACCRIAMDKALVTCQGRTPEANQVS